MLDVLLLVAGLALLLGGGDALVRGASGIAALWGVSPAIVGLTIVAFGTSAPELVVNLVASASGKSDIAFGNIVGSNLVNIGLILGPCALIRPLAIHGRIVVREIPFLILTSVFALLLALDHELRDLPAAFDRIDGLALLLLFAVFLYTAVGDVVRDRQNDALLAQAAVTDRWNSRFRHSAMHLVLVALGLGALIGGGQLTVDAASELARAAGVSEAIIGLSLVAFGTSLPELATSAVAVLRGETDIAVGNIVGSNIFNLLFILGISATMSPVPVPEGGTIDLIAALALALLLLPFCASGQKTLSRTEGGLLAALYVGYSAWRFFGVGAG